MRNDTCKPKCLSITLNLSDGIYYCYGINEIALFLEPLYITENCTQMKILRRIEQKHLQFMISQQKNISSGIIYSNGKQFDGGRQIFWISSIRKWKPWTFVCFFIIPFHDGGELRFICFIRDQPALLDGWIVGRRFVFRAIFKFESYKVNYYYRTLWLQFFHLFLTVLRAIQRSE